MVSRIKQSSGGLMKAYAGFVKFFKEELGWTSSKADAEWQRRKSNIRWPRGAHPEDGQLTLALFVDDGFSEENEIAHEAGVEGQNKDRKNLDPTKFQEMVNALREGPPGEKFDSQLFDANASDALKLTSASALHQAPRAVDFCDDAKSVKNFMMKEGLLEQPAEQEANAETEGAEANPQESAAEAQEMVTPTKKEFHALTSIADLRFRALQACDSLKRTTESAVPEMEKLITQMEGRETLNESKRLLQESIQWSKAFLQDPGAPDELPALIQKVKDGNMGKPCLNYDNIVVVKVLFDKSKDLGDQVENETQYKTIEKQWDNDIAAAKGLVDSIARAKILATRQLGMVQRKEESVKQKEVAAKAAAQNAAAKAKGKGKGEAKINSATTCQNKILEVDLKNHLPIPTLDLKTDNLSNADLTKPLIVLNAIDNVHVAQDPYKLQLLLFKAKAPSMSTWASEKIAMEEVTQADALQQQLRQVLPIQKFGWVDKDAIVNKLFFFVPGLPQNPPTHPQ